MDTEFANTDKQQEIMALVVNAAARGRQYTVNSLRAALSYTPERSAMHSSIRFLKKHGYIVTKNCGRNGSLVIPTAAGMTRFKPKPMI